MSEIENQHHGDVHCPGCGEYCTYSHNGQEMITECKDCNSIRIELGGSPFPYISKTRSYCPFCGSAIQRYKISDCGEAVQFCGVCYTQFIKLQEEGQ
ncbi:hypothetical protein A3207_00555 [Candidatus Methanomassiliicoccus intestinalis]|uniref:Uncharacterized protein n=2 Tax=Candidatus Methanomassiliicoccus intestinalis TaxID=1406512 RepID=R9T5V0_METII|nr:hypothetical protein [Candidatus Methanomassiliicoccus intestinalis]AGN26362.1 hypothetical protein MMINT_10130 [Candidatus Methanomassiliicoccus intestinalis Issoire-Mx1]TQS84566.1 MAG: hypothetical protein A3207_00555 [Candidatus Methanomassiliicoccus intestinalis]